MLHSPASPDIGLTQLINLLLVSHLLLLILLLAVALVYVAELLWNRWPIDTITRQCIYRSTYTLPVNTVGAGGCKNTRCILY